MNEIQQQTEQQHPTEGMRKQWAQPRLKKYGTLRDLTRTDFDPLYGPEYFYLLNEQS